jgi:nifR3 family TIM-barrel protein
MPFSWNTLPRPIIALSPMADMTDSPFCLLAKRYGARIVFREMVSAEAVVRGNEKTLGMTAFDEAERPLIQQIFGSDPVVVAEAARIIEEQFHPDGFDLNMGCPVYKITHNFNGAALMREPERAEAIIRAVKKGITVPLSVKIRLGWSDPTDCLSFAPRIEAAGADLITVHGRTKTQGYSGVSDWKMIARVKQVVRIPLLANGDIHTPEAARDAMAVTGADGILVARGALGNPWVLRQMEEMLATGQVKTTISIAERQAATLEHMRLAVAHYGDRAPVLMRKHLAWYWKGIPYAQELRKALVHITSPEEMAEIYKDFAGKV